MYASMRDELEKIALSPGKIKSVYEGAAAALKNTAAGAERGTKAFRMRGKLNGWQERRSAGVAQKRMNRSTELTRSLPPEQRSAPTGPVGDQIAHLQAKTKAQQSGRDLLRVVSR